MTPRRSRLLLFVLAIASITVFALAPAADSQAAARIKDVADVEGVRNNQLIGYGLVVGLAGTGDRSANAPFTETATRSMLERLGVAVSEDELRTRNVAAVMVTAKLGPFARPGGAVDVEVSALGDAKSLLGGVLLATPLQAGDGRVYAVAQGPLVVQGFAASGEAASIQRGVPTSARIPNGAIIERDPGFSLSDIQNFRLVLRHADFTTAVRVADAVNATYGEAARAIDPTTIELALPTNYQGREAYFLASIENLAVSPDAAARVVVDERTGTVVIGAGVRLSPVAITQGGVTITVSETPIASQPAPGSQRGETQVLPRTSVAVEEGGANAPLQVVAGSDNLQQLVDGLNALGVGARDIIAILEATKAVGALHADLVVR